MVCTIRSMNPSSDQPDVVRLSFALSPAEPLFSEIIRASQAITDRHENSNIIDADRFPPHLSLHICTVPRSSMEEIASTFDGVDPGSFLPRVSLSGVVKGSRGYIHIGAKRTSELMSLHEAVIEIAAKARAPLAAEPRSPQRGVPPGREELLQRYGNAYVLDAFDPHFSVAKVPQYDHIEAFGLAEDVLRQLRTEAEMAAFEICDIGMQNEKWEPVYRRTA